MMMMMMMNDGYDGAYRRILHGILPRALPSTLWHIDFVICMSTRRIFDERASERADDDEAMKICHSNVSTTYYCPRYFPPSVTPPPHTNVAISRRADDDDNKQATVREWTKIRHNKQSRVVVCGTDLLIATNNTHRYYIIFIMIVTYYYVGP